MQIGCELRSEILEERSIKGGSISGKGYAESSITSHKSKSMKAKDENQYIE